MFKVPVNLNQPNFKFDYIILTSVCNSVGHCSFLSVVCIYFGTATKKNE